MKILNLFGKRDVSADLEKPVPYKLAIEFLPYKLFANRRSSSSMFIKIRNMTQEPLMTSLVIDVPTQLSLDETGLTKTKEVRLGDIPSETEKECRIDVYSSSSTDKGEYTISLTAFAHYRDYAHVLNSMKKRTALNVVDTK